MKTERSIMDIRLKAVKLGPELAGRPGCGIPPATLCDA